MQFYISNLNNYFDQYEHMKYLILKYSFNNYNLIIIIHHFKKTFFNFLILFNLFDINI